MPGHIPPVGVVKTLIARQKFAEERYPLAPTLKPVREALAKLDPKPEPMPLPPAKAHVPSLAVQRRKKRR